MTLQIIIVSALFIVVLAALCKTLRDIFKPEKDSDYFADSFINEIKRKKK